MQLISMSLHAKLKSQRIFLEDYVGHLRDLLSKLSPYAPLWRHKNILPAETTAKRHLIILAGSQRGLCGSFNTMLIQAYNTYINTLGQNPTIEVIVIGNKITDYFKESIFPQAIRTFSTLTEQSIKTIAQEISRHIVTTQSPYSSVVIIHNESRGFFAQKPKLSRLIPLEPSHMHNINQDEELIWYSAPEKLLDNLVPAIIEGTLTFLIFESFLAEQAARFVSMDSSTRNAQKLLATMKLQYNKLRQTKITQELIELSGASTSLP